MLCDIMQLNVCYGSRPFILTTEQALIAVRRASDKGPLHVYLDDGAPFQMGARSLENFMGVANKLYVVGNMLMADIEFVRTPATLMMQGIALSYKLEGYNNVSASGVISNLAITSLTATCKLNIC